MDAHPLAALLPMLDGSEWASFLADIKANGVRTPIVLHNGQILDGRNRWRASQALGVACPSETFTGTDELGFVMSANLHRRHLSTDQRATIAASMSNALRGRSKQSNGPNGPFDPITCQQAATLMHVSARSVKRAKAAGKNAASEKPKHDGYKQAAVEHGLLSMSDAMNNNSKGRLEAVRDKIAVELGISSHSLAKGRNSFARGLEIEAACAVIAERDQAALADRDYEAHRREVAKLPAEWRAKFERVVEREMKRIAVTYDDDVRRAADAKIPERVAYFEQTAAECEVERKDYIVMRKGMTALLVESDFRFLLNALHPDRAPDREKLIECFRIVNKLQPYVYAANRK